MIKTVVFDIDDTIADLRNPMCKALNAFSKKDFHWKQWKSFDIVSKYEIRVDDFYKCIVENNILENIKPHSDTKKILTDLNDQGYNLVIITSRSYHPDAYNLTKRWFDKYDLPYDKIHISSHEKPKTVFLERDQEVIMAVDDRIENCEDFIRHGIPHTYLYNMPWNKESSLPRIQNLSELRNIINI